jgi:hypothetical protein
MPVAWTGVQMLARPAWPCILASLFACSARNGAGVDGAPAPAGGEPDVGLPSPAPDASTAEAVPLDAPGADAGTPDGPLPPSWDRYLWTDPPTVRIDCSKPERVLEVSARVQLQGPPDAPLSVELGQFSLELGLERGSRSCMLNGPVMPISVGPVSPGTSAAVTASARGTCQAGATLADPCDSCGRSATAVLGMQVRSGSLTAPWTSRGLGVQPGGTAVTVTCTGAP